MDYGSSHVFVYANSDEEVISDAEYNEGMWLSDSDEDTSAAIQPNKVIYSYTHACLPVLNGMVTVMYGKAPGPSFLCSSVPCLLSPAFPCHSAVHVNNHMYNVLRTQKKRIVSISLTFFSSVYM
jgi:hypothetical protein